MSRYGGFASALVTTLILALSSLSLSGCDIWTWQDPASDGDKEAGDGDKDIAETEKEATDGDADTDDAPNDGDVTDGDTSDSADTEMEEDGDHGDGDTDGDMTDGDAAPDGDVDQDAPSDGDLTELDTTETEAETEPEVEDLICTGGICTDPATGFEWQETPTGGTMNWDSAVTHCQNLDLGGMGWRLPNISELRTLVRNCDSIATGGACGVKDVCSPCGDATACFAASSCWTPANCSPTSCAESGSQCYWPPQLSGTCNWYWSSSSPEDVPITAWLVAFSFGHVDNSSKDANNYVRCVRDECVPASHAGDACDSGDVYWFDSCGDKEEIKEECDDCVCTGNSCVVEDRYALKCYDGDLYWYDCHGARKAKEEECWGLGCFGTSCKLTNGFVRITAGVFMMGSPENEAGRASDETQHQVTLTYDFEMQTKEVTQFEFLSYYGHPSWFGPYADGPDCTPNCPVERVNFYEALAYANWRSAQAGLPQCYVLSGCTGMPGEGCDANSSSCSGGYTCTSVALNGLNKPQECLGYRLPTESEWEYAARAGSTAAYPDGLESDLQHLACQTPFHLTDIAWYCANAENTTHTGGTKAANAWGLYDLLGNVNEMVWDKYDDYPGSATDPYGTNGFNENWMRVQRGGSWANEARYSRLATRFYNFANSKSSNVGFRLVRSLP